MDVTSICRKILHLRKLERVPFELLKLTSCKCGAVVFIWKDLKFFSKSKTLLSRFLHKSCIWLLNLKVFRRQGEEVPEIPHWGIETSVQPIAGALNMQRWKCMNTLQKAGKQIHFISSHSCLCHVMLLSS